MTRLIVIGASAGGVGVLIRMAQGLPADLPAAVLVVLHIGQHRSLLPELLSSKGALPAAHARDGEPITAGRIVVAPPDYHLLVDGASLRLSHGAKEHHARPAIDPLFRSAALAHGPRTIGVVLSGMLDDGTAGLQAVKQCGGLAVVQDPADAKEPSMPKSALRHVAIDHRVDAAGLAELLSTLARQELPAMTETLDPPDPLRHEVALMLHRGDALEHLQRIGTPSIFVCPDCHGTLWQIEGAEPPRYRCHTGHGFSQRSLEHTLTTARDEAIWNAMRAVQENGFMLKRMAEQRDGDPDDAARLHSAAQRLEQQTEVLRTLLEQGPPSVAG
jgi:two-component system chemotaxis response regulator CheB